MRYFASFKCTSCTKHFSSFEYFKRHKKRHQRRYQYHDKATSTITKSWRYSSRSVFMKKYNRRVQVNLPQPMQGIEINENSQYSTLEVEPNTSPPNQQHHLKCEICCLLKPDDTLIEHLHAQTAHICTYSGSGHHQYMQGNLPQPMKGIEINENSQYSTLKVEPNTSPPNQQHHLKCLICYLLIPDDKLNEHLQTAHTSTYCGPGHHQYLYIKSHLTNEHYCAYCEKYLSKSDLRIHQRSQHFQCSDCKKYFTHKKGLRIHQKSAHAHVGCVYCNMRITKSDLQLHLKSEHFCEYCKKCFAKEYLKLHLKSEHFCEYCKSFFTKEDLNLHLRSEHLCVYCKTFFSKGDLKLHVKSEHFCIYCKTFYSKKDLHLHLRSEHMCVYCKTFFSNGDLKLHMKSTEHLCSYCQKSFTHKDLKRHLTSEHLCVYCKKYVEVRKLHLESEHICMVCKSHYITRKRSNFITNLSIYVRIARSFLQRKISNFISNLNIYVCIARRSS
ncbi:uncharacterized protein [Amphiura filiformis]|uniref:uncharacterized protein n=1 Tax=Amphiura filiformis TaxID=82378 RepID=UPI003B212761